MRRCGPPAHPRKRRRLRPRRWPTTSAGSTTSIPSWLPIRGEIKALEGQIVIVKWITGATFAGLLALILRTFVAA